MSKKNRNWKKAIGTIMSKGVGRFRVLREKNLSVIRHYTIVVEKENGMRLYLHEMKINVKTLVIWTICVGGLCFGCILLYSSLEDSLQGMAEAYSDLGAMSVAFGMDKMSIATLTGFYATEVAMMHGLGGAMFAAILGSGLLAKEEAGHTAEFLNTLPVSRSRIFWQKYGALVSEILLFHLICVTCYLIGFAAMGEEILWKEMLLYHGAQFLMLLEIGTLCFLLSAFSRRIQMGAGLGITILLFAADMMCRILPAVEDIKYITPFYYSNAPDILTTGEVEPVMLGIGMAVIVIALLIAAVKYCKKDIAS